MQDAVKISIKPFPRLRSKTIPVLILFFFAGFQEIFSQVYDDFSDGDFLSAPAWRGSVDHFLVNESHQLQLNAVAAGKSWLASEFSPEPSMALEWQIYIRQSFAPSGSNYGRFYLTADHADLSAPLNGYYLQFGEAGSGDAVELFRQSGTSSTSVCRGRAGAIAGAFAIRVKIQHLPDGTWHLFVDYAGGTDYILESTGLSDDAPTGSYFGILCSYTVSNIRGFYFDDVKIDATPLPDTSPPTVRTVDVVDSRTLRVGFSEALDVASVKAGSFSVIPGGEPIAVTLDEEGWTTTLLFGSSFPNGVESVLHVKDISDRQGNTIVAIDVPFLFFEELPVAYRDIVISEILADPTPPRALPEAEFLELYNRSEIPVDLSGWILSDNTGVVALPSYLLLPKRYVILTAKTFSEDYGKYGATLALTGFPSLNNGGDRLVLKDDRGQVLDSVNYADDWYRDEEKADGGWSLERIDPDDVCGEHENWTASEAVEGGTPGTRNASHASRPDNRGPRLLSIVPLDSLALLISFDEKLDETLPGIDQFLIEGGPDVVAVRFADPTLVNLSVTLSEPIQPGRSYTLTVGDLYDCPGNRILPDQAIGSFLLPEEADTGDVVINEVLFNPRPTGVDFIEVFNPSTKVFNLNGWILRNARGAHRIADPSAAKSLLLFPGQYLVFTEDADVLKGEYVMGAEETFFEIELPSLNDDEGSVALLNENQLVIDSMHYSDEMHSGIIKDDEGVSLERISVTGGSSDVSNWRSASSVSGFATPGYINSNARYEFAMSSDAVVVAPEIIRQQVAQHDFARIQYQFTRGGLIANVKICDPQGRTIRTIAENELLGTEGFFRWDGDTDGRMLATTGYYMVLFEVFGLDGFRQAFRNRVVVY